MTSQSRRRRGRNTELLFTEYLKQEGWVYAEATSASASGTDITGVLGVDFELNYVTEFAAQGCTSNSPYTNLGVLFDPHEIIVWYMGDGTSDPSFTILNDLGDPVSLTWSSICQKTCYESSVPIPSSDPTIYMLDPMGPAFLSFVQPSSTFGTIDVSNPSSIVTVQSYYQQCCGIDATINVTTDDNGDYIVQILNVYVSLTPTWYNGTVGPVFFNEMSC